MGWVLTSWTSSTTCHGCESDIYLNCNISSRFPINQGVQQGDTLSPLLFIIAINPLLEWISRGNTGHQFANGLTIPVVVYCDDIALVSCNAEDLEEITYKLIQFGAWAGLEVNMSKSVHTCARAGRPAVLRAPDATNPMGQAAIPWAEKSET